MEMVYQYLVVILLFFPKLVLVSIALLYVPYLYPIGMVLEWLMVLFYNKAMYGNFNGFDNGNLITILTPALFQALQTSKKCKFFDWF